MIFTGNKKTENSYRVAMTEGRLGAGMSFGHSKMLELKGFKENPYEVIR